MSVEKPSVENEIRKALADTGQKFIKENANNEKICLGCKYEFKDNDVKYKCHIHNLIYCKDCVTNKGKSFIDYKETKWICAKKFRTNCIYKKIEPPEKDLNKETNTH